MEFCPVCMLRKGLTDGVDCGESSASEDTYKPSTPEHAVQRFEHYALVKGEDGKPVELGRGAMGITYKAVHVDLHCPVTLKVISERYLGDESARLRFLREARAAASVRHPNVASVFHLGRTAQSYFYAMEFVEGETLENLIKRSGRLEVNLVLEIATQVAAGLAAIHKEKLVHRDIKPSNIMVSVEEEGIVRAKIIDLGLAKPAPDVPVHGAISTAGAFAGTPEFASPEQFAGVGVDIRSDLYSLGITLWKALTGQVPFQGSPAEVMHQHLHASLPLGQLEYVPQPVAVLVEILLEKVPTRRFQSPAELLKAMPNLTGAIEMGRVITRERLQRMSPADSFSRSHRLHARLGPKSIAVLPFDSLSDDKRDSYFADGVQDEILANLARVSQLKVISRTSVMGYRTGGNRVLPSIADALGVATIVEGTVRRAGGRVRITTRLVDGGTDETLWSESYDRDLTDIFIIQSEVAKTIATKMSATLSPQEKKNIEAKLTDNLEAYDLYLQAKKLIDYSDSISALEAIHLLERALQLDPKFKSAYCLSAKGHDYIYSGLDMSQMRRALGDAAINRALVLRPDLPEVHVRYAYHLYMGYRDYERARVQLAIATRGMPNNSEAMMVAAYMDRRQGNFDKAIQQFSEAIAVDPLNPTIELANTFLMTRQFSAAAQQYDRGISLAPDHLILNVLKAYLINFMKTGESTALRRELAMLPASMAEDPDVLNWWLVCALDDRDWQRAIELVEKMKGGEDDGHFAYAELPVPAGCYSILISRLRGEKLSGNSTFTNTREQLSQKVQRSPKNARLLSQLAVVDALLGNKHDSIVEANHAVELLPISKDAVDGPLTLLNQVVVYAWTDELDLAFETLNPLTKTPRGIYYGQLKRDPYFDPLRKDSRFEKILAELASN